MPLPQLLSALGRNTEHGGDDLDRERCRSKERLLSAFGSYELAKIQSDLEAATEGLTGAARLDAVLAFIVRFQSQGTYSLSRLVEVDYVLDEVARVLPIMRRFIEKLLDGDDAPVVAATIVRVAVSPYLIEGDDKVSFLDQLRHAAGITPDSGP
ncbi:hypothetical protein OG225_11775 [Nocardia sp. NBC_01377]|uniref:hypothetical protein n=1 Tax=Nocardia sp. NBC_01377 TaxID=2903595 RepID=UPI0032506E7C